jgi:hypothetical protein
MCAEVVQVHPGISLVELKRSSFGFYKFFLNMWRATFEIRVRDCQYF